MSYSRRNVLRLGLGSLWTAAASAEIEPLVRLIERTPREKCLDLLASQLKSGVPYRKFLAALYLAGARNVNPRPPGFALHCLFVIWSAHSMSLDSPENERLLPLAYALDNFKGAQDRDARATGGDYTMGPLSGALPPASRAREELQAAMEAWDQDRAERAVVAVLRAFGPAAVIEMLWRYGARDYRNIGHKAIFAANAWRTLQVIGWEHAEPVYRSLVLGMLDFGPKQTVNGYAFEDQSYLANAKRAKTAIGRLGASWNEEAGDPAAARDLLGVLRGATVEEACQQTLDGIVKGKWTAGSVWDAAHLAAAEVRMRCTGGLAITGIHAVTALSGLRHSYLAALDPETRLLVLLQGVGWATQFRTFAATRVKDFRDFTITALEPAEGGGVEDVFADLPKEPDRAAARVMRLAGDAGMTAAFAGTARRLVYRKASEVHYYKYAPAIFEDLPLVGAAWRPHLLAATVYYLKGSAEPDLPLMTRAIDALHRV